MAPDTLRDLLDAIAARAEMPAVICVRPDGGMDTVSCGELARRAHDAAARLVKAGMRRGEPVALIGPNSAEWIAGFFGILGAGALPVPLDAQAGGRDLVRILAHSGARRALTTPAHAQLLRDQGAPALQVTLLGELAAPAPPGDAGELPGLLPGLRPDDTAALFYTSGTTGTPKGVPLTHRNLLANVQAVVATRLVGSADRLLLPLPLHHTYPFTVGLLGGLATGAAVVLPAGVTGPQLVAAIRGAGVTLLLGVPRLYTALLAGIEAKARAGAVSARLFPGLLALSTAITRRTGIRAGRRLFARLHREMGPTLRILVSGGARLDPDVAWRLEGLGWEVMSGYGLTETAPILAINMRGHVRHEAVGRALPGVEIRIAAPPGQTAGEIQARGPNVFAGYRDNPEATGLAFTPDGWFRTGDVGQIDREGYVHIVGRMKEIIVLPDGKKLAPEDVETAYAASPLVREIALLEQGGRLVALVVPDEAAVRERGAARLANMMREELEGVSVTLPGYQRVTDFRLSREPLPRTPMGKLQRFRLPELFDAAGAAARAPPAAAPGEADRALLGSPAGQQVWAWLQARFADQPLSLDASPQLDLGVDSLEWLALTLEIRDRFGVELGQDAVARVLTVRDLVQAVLSAPDRPAAPRPVAASGGAAARGPVLRATGLAFYAVGRLLMRAMFRLRVEGVEHLPAAGGFLLAPNHASYLDPVAVAAALPWRMLPRVRWAGWTEFMFRAWHWRLLSRATGVFPVDPDREPAAAMATGAAILGAGQVLCWFPEGRRTLTGELGPFLPGVAVLLRQSGCRAVPVRVLGSYAALPRQRRWPRPVPITVVFGPPLAVPELAALGEGASEPERIAAGLRCAVARLGGGP